MAKNAFQTFLAHELWVTAASNSAHGFVPRRGPRLPQPREGQEVKFEMGTDCTQNFTKIMHWTRLQTLRRAKNNTTQSSIRQKIDARYTDVAIRGK